jgi:hypothetical protein
VDNVLQDKWRLICPPKNWRQPVPIDEEELSLLGIISERLSLVLTRDDERKKIYLGTALASDATTANGIRYANGWRADVVLDEDAGAEYKSVDPGAAAPLIRAFPDAQISKSFRLSEFYPKGTQRPGRHTYEYIRLSPSLVNALEEIRERTGRPVTVTSGYRPPAYNREVGGVSNSCHIVSEALPLRSAWPPTSTATVSRPISCTTSANRSSVSGAASVTIPSRDLSTSTSAATKPAGLAFESRLGWDQRLDS